MLRVLLLGLSISGDSPLFVFLGQGDRKDPSDQREDRINRCPKPRFGLRDLRGLIGFMGDAYTVIPRSKATWGSPFAWREIATSGRAFLAMTLTLSSRPHNDDTPSKPSSPPEPTPRHRFGLRGLIEFMGDAFTVIPRSEATWGSPFAWREIATSGRDLLAMTLTLSSRPRNDAYLKGIKNRFWRVL